MDRKGNIFYCDDSYDDLEILDYNVEIFPNPVSDVLHITSDAPLKANTYFQCLRTRSKSHKCIAK